MSLFRIIRLIAVVAAFVVAIHACAQEYDGDENEVLLLADFGFGGVLPAGVWSPVAVTVSADDKPISGVVRLSWELEGRTVSAVAPFAAAPEATVTVHMVTWLHRWLDQVTISAIDDRRGVVASVVYSQRPNARQLKLESPWYGSPPVLSLAADVNAPRLASLLSEMDDRTDPIAGVNLRTTSLPLHEQAYDGIVCIAVDGETLEGIDPRAVGALKRWVASGGHVLVVPDAAGDRWRQWLDGFPVVDMVSFGSSRFVTLAEGEVLSARPIELDPRAHAIGWRTDGTVAAEYPLLASGPAGLGWITLAGAWPAASGDDPTELERSFVSAAFRDHLEMSNNAIDSATAQPPAARNAFGFGTDTDDDAILREVDAIVETQAVGLSALLFVAGLSLGLAVLVGPLDYMVLGRLKRRHLAWASVLIWLAGVSVIAFVAPRLIRVSDSSVSRFEIVDLIASNLAIPRGDLRNSATMMGGQPPAWRSGVTVLYAGSKDPISVSADTGGGAWRPLVSADYWSGITRVGMTLAQSAASADPWAPRGVRPVSIPAGTWSATVLRDAGSSSVRPGVALRRDAAGWVVDLTGLALSAGIEGATLTIGDAVFHLAEAVNSTEPLVFPLEAGQKLEAYSGTTRRLSRMLLQTEPARRDPSIDRLLQSGWALIELRIHDGPTDPAFDVEGSSDQRTEAIWRIVLPIGSASDAAAAEGVGG